MKIPLLRTWFLCKRKGIGVGFHPNNFASLITEYGGILPEHSLFEDDMVKY